MNVVFIWKEGTLKVSREEYAVMGRHQHPQVLPLSPLLLWWPLNIGHVTWRGYNGVHLDKAASMWAIWLFLSGSLMHLNSCDSSQHFPRRKEELLQTSYLRLPSQVIPICTTVEKPKACDGLETWFQMFWEKVHAESRSCLSWTSAFQNREKSSVCD